jgi:hypothetical protein
VEDITNVVIRPCGCQSAFQDARYGLHNRVHNLTNGGLGRRPGDAACTVCGAYHGPVVKKVKAKALDTKTTGISRMGGRKAGLKGKKGKGKKQQ